ncbi:MAG: bifunctional riboflavin kinase/FMN adenylyltransferase [Planctomycetota bacterium]
MADAPTAVSIGTFDGVHVGHRALIEAARAEVGPGGRVVVLAFEPHPATVLSHRPAPPRLTSWLERDRLIRSAGADEVRALDPRSGLLELSAAEFIDHVVAEFRPSVLVEGTDFRFGSHRDGSIETLRELGHDRGFELRVVPDLEVILADGSPRRASSTLLRELLGQGRVRDAAAVLGRRYAIDGEVIQGDRLGRQVGVPTANIAFETLPPADGVYAARALLPDGRDLAAAVNVGERPTVNGVDLRVEAHLLGLPTSFDGDGTPDQRWRTLHEIPEYGWPLRIEFVGRLRDQVKFGSIDELVGQLRRDCARAETVARGTIADDAIFGKPEPTGAPA